LDAFGRLDLLCFVDAGFPLHFIVVVSTFLRMRVPAPLFSVYLEFGITESLESNAALVVMISFVAQWFSPWLGAVCPIPFLFLQCFARTAKKFSAKSFGRLLNGLHVSQLWETLTDASVAM